MYDIYRLRLLFASYNQAVNFEYVSHKALDQLDSIIGRDTTGGQWQDVGARRPVNPVGARLAYHEKYAGWHNVPTAPADDSARYSFWLGAGA